MVRNNYDQTENEEGHLEHCEQCQEAMAAIQSMHSLLVATLNRTHQDLPSSFKLAANISVMLNQMEHMRGIIEDHPAIDETCGNSLETLKLCRAAEVRLKHLLQHIVMTIQTLNHTPGLRELVEHVIEQHEQPSEGNEDHNRD